MSEQRDELITRGMELAHPDWCLSVPHVAKETILDLIAVLEATRPRIVNTAEELDALPNGSVVQTVEIFVLPNMDVYPICYQRLYTGQWHRGGRRSDTHPANMLPAIVLYEPTP